MSDRLIETCEVDGRKVVVYQRYTEYGYGPMPTEVYFDCVAPQWPKVRIRSRRRLTTMLARLWHGPGLQLDDPEFNKAFRVDAGHEDFAVALLSPEMQQFLLEKRTVDWSVGNGSLKLFYRGKLKRDRMERSLDRLRRFWQLIPPELEAW